MNDQDLELELDEDLLKELEDAAEEQGITVNDLVHQILTAMLDEQDRGSNSEPQGNGDSTEDSKSQDLDKDPNRTYERIKVMAYNKEDMIITRDKIRELRDEALSKEDLILVALCERALEGDEVSWGECASLLEERASTKEVRPAGSVRADNIASVEDRSTRSGTKVTLYRLTESAARQLEIAGEIPAASKGEGE